MMLLLLKTIMKTICTNLECLQTYQVNSTALGKLVRCKRCNTIFEIQEVQESIQASDLLTEDEESENAEVAAQLSESAQKTKRKSSQEVLEAKIKAIQTGINGLLPSLITSYNKREKESDTRLLIDRILREVLGYQIEDIKTEQKIQGKKADYVLSVNEEDSLIVEAKAICQQLKELHIYQATAYGAYAGIRWVLLTNGLVWTLYRVSIGEKISHNQVFTIDLLDGIDEKEAEYFYLISHEGMGKKQLLEKLWKKIWAMSQENLINALLSDDVINKVRIALGQQTGYKATNEELKLCIEEKILQLS